MIIEARRWRQNGRFSCSAVQSEPSQSGVDVSVQIVITVVGGLHFRVRVRQQEMTRARYVFGESRGQTRPASLLERETRSFHQKPANRC